MEIIEVADEQTPDSASEMEELQIKAKEAQRIHKYIKEDTYLIALAMPPQNTRNQRKQCTYDKFFSFHFFHLYL